MDAEATPPLFLSSIIANIQGWIAFDIMFGFLCMLRIMLHGLVHSGPLHSS
jgi:hypothetical protein